jgi:hypothetical protein
VDADSVLKVPVVRTLLQIAMENLVAAQGGDQFVGNALATSIFSAAAIEAGLSAFIYTATLIRGTSADPGPGFWHAVEEAVVKSAKRGNRSIPANPLGDTREDYHRALWDSKLGVRTQLDIVMDYCEAMAGKSELKKAVNRLLDTRNTLVHPSPEFLDADAYDAWEAGTNGHFVIGGPPREAPSETLERTYCGLDYGAFGAGARDQAAEHLEVATEFLKLLTFAWRRPE